MVSTMNRSKFTLILLILFLLVSACGPVQPVSSSNEPEVITHPDGQLYVGDKVSFEVLAPAGQKGQDESVSVTFEGKDLGRANIGGFGIGGRQEAVLWWAWDTSGLKPGPYTLTFSRSPDETTWNETITLHPAGQVPPPEPEANWAEVTTTCCILHYITGTAAARDIATLSREADEQSAAISEQLHYQLKTHIDVTLMSRVIGQGGFTTNSVYLSYLDGNYMGNEMPILFHHEFVHFYDGQIGGKYRPSIFEEGLAVYLTGGHFKPEPLGPRGAALLDLGWYIPLSTVADNFYNQQHDIGYLEAADLVKYLVDTYGWDAFNQFYRDIPAPDGRSDTAVIDQALRQHFNVSFDEMEKSYLAWLHAQSFTPAERTDLRLTVEFFNTVRRYQKALDISAYFLTAWLPDGAVMRQRGIVADFLRHPEKPDNRLLEFLFVQAWQNLAAGNYTATDLLLKVSNGILDLLGG